MDETGGDREPSFAGATFQDILSENPGSIVGVIDNALNIPSSTWTKLQIPYATALANELVIGNFSWTWNLWVYSYSNNDEGLVVPFSQYRGQVNKRGLRIQLDNIDTGEFRVTLSSDGVSEDGDYVLSNNRFGAASFNTWYMLSVRHDADNNEFWLSVNGGSHVSRSIPQVFPSLADVTIGSEENNNNNWFGRVDLIGFWKSFKTDSDLEFLYNDGNGQQPDSSGQFSDASDFDLGRPAIRNIGFDPAIRLIVGD